MKETQFSKELTEKLKNTKMEIVGKNKKIDVNALHQPSFWCGRPDIAVYHGQEREMKWHKLSDPFYIECKLKQKQLQKQIQQFLKYKYDQNSKKNMKNAKYGDYQVVATCPEFLGPNFNPQAREEWLNTFQLIRTLWALGIGILYNHSYSRNSDLQIVFNEQERLHFSETDTSQSWKEEKIKVENYL